MLSELSRREREMAINPDPQVDAFLTLAMSSDHGEHLATEYILKV